MSEKTTTYGLGEKIEAQDVAAPQLPYRPQNSQSYAPNIGLIACGGITARHWSAYRKAGCRVSMLCNHDCATMNRKSAAPQRLRATPHAALERRGFGGAKRGIFERRGPRRARFGRLVVSRRLLGQHGRTFVRHRGITRAEQRRARQSQKPEIVFCRLRQRRCGGAASAWRSASGSGVVHRGIGGES